MVAPKLRRIAKRQNEFEKWLSANGLRPKLEKKNIVSQFQKLDDLIVARIAGKGIQFTPLFSSNDVREESQRLGVALDREPFRVLDGRLQALKAQRQISYGTKTGWVKSEPKQVAADTI